MKTGVWGILLAGVALLTACAGGERGKITPVDSHAHWKVGVTSGDRKTALCYAVSSPIKSAGSYSDKRSTPYLMVTRRLSGKLEVSAYAGYPYREVGIDVGDESYSLIFKDSIAWAKDAGEDAAILEGLLTTGSVEVYAVARNGKDSRDTYSTEGVEDAIAQVKELCP